MGKKKVNMGFGEWLFLACKYDDYLRGQMISLAALLDVSFLMMLAYGLWELPIGMGVALWLVLCWRWKKALANPPWYLKEERKDV